MKKDVDYYMGLPYTIEVTPLLEKEGGGFHACVPLLGRFAICADGKTHQEAIDNLLDFMRRRIKVYLEEGTEIKEPLSLMQRDEQIFKEVREKIVQKKGRPKPGNLPDKLLSFKDFITLELGPEKAEEILAECRNLFKNWEL